MVKLSCDIVGTKKLSAQLSERVPGIIIVQAHNSFEWLVPGPVAMLRDAGVAALLICTINTLSVSGSCTVTNLDLGTQEFPSHKLGGQWHARIWFPQCAASNQRVTPVIVFVSGLSGLIPCDLYDQMLQRVAMSNVIAVALDRPVPLRPGLPIINYTRLAYHLGSVLEYIGGAMVDDLRAHGFRGTPSPGVILAGHSAGNHVIVRRTVTFGCDHIKGFILIDPVDGEDPYGTAIATIIHVYSSQSQESFISLSSIHRPQSTLRRLLSILPLAWTP